MEKQISRIKKATSLKAHKDALYMCIICINNILDPISANQNIILFTSKVINWSGIVTKIPGSLFIEW